MVAEGDGVWPVEVSIGATPTVTQISGLAAGSALSFPANSCRL